MYFQHTLCKLKRLMCKRLHRGNQWSMYWHLVELWRVHCMMYKLGTLYNIHVGSNKTKSNTLQPGPGAPLRGLVCVKAPLSGFHAHQSACELSLGSLSYSRSTLPRDSFSHRDSFFHELAQDTSNRTRMNRPKLDYSP